ncbi:MAG TPA: ABC transporter permease [Candidatus Sulfotelmatobacter sp.]|nr:ABC transporter permease [Candidatus Sulfotelmatobacter sp.]
MSATAATTERPAPPAAARGRPGLRGWLLTLGGIATFLVAWKLLVVVAGYPRFVLPAPEVVAARFVSAWADGTMEPHAAATIEEIVGGLVIGVGLALPLGALLGRSRLAEQVLAPYFVAAQATPILAVAPLIALWFGTGLVAISAICAIVLFFPVTVATMVGVRSVDPRLVEMATAFRATPRQRLLWVEVPAALPAILGGLRVGVTLAVVGAIVGEWAGANAGLGVLINLARGSLFDTPLLFATLLTIALLGIGLYLLVLLVERRLVGVRA